MRPAALAGAEVTGRSSVLLAVLGVAIAGVSALAYGTAAAHSARFNDKVTINTDPDFHGRVVSRWAGCKRGRTVRIYRAETGPDGLFTSTRTGNDGRWQFLSPSLTGDFYARIGARVARSAGHRHVCRGARSRSVHVQP